MPFDFRDDIALADVAFDAWGASLEELFRECAAALLRTMVAEPATVRRETALPLELMDTDLEMLLFSFLQELVFLKDARQLLVCAATLQIVEEDGHLKLSALLHGEAIDRQRHPLLVDVKAVTLHRFQIVQDDSGWRATVVLDV